MRRRLAVLLFALVLTPACGAGGPQVFEARGVVEEVQAEYGQIVIAHEDIPGLMPAMTMNFDVADPGLLERLTPGQAIAFRLRFDGRSYRVLDAQVIGSAAVGEGARIAELAGAADPAPDFALTDQDGSPLVLDTLRGKVVLLDFVYTHCPGPCPILTGVHATVQRSLPAELAGRVHFVSVSLDPVRDTPEALRAYARARGADLASWSFLTGAPEQVGAVLRAYGVAARPAENGEIDHLVVTFLIDPAGRIARRYIGLDHDAETLRRDLAALVLAAGGEGA